MTPAGRDACDPRDSSGDRATEPVVIRHELTHPDGRHLWVYGELRGSLAGDAVPPSEPAALHQRYDALTDTWIAVSPSRNRRPFTGAGPGASGSVAPPAAPAPTAVACPLCPGGPEVPFSYEAAVFENRFPSFVRDPPPVAPDEWIAPSKGACDVVLYTEHHVGSLATLTPLERARVIAMWRDRTAARRAEPGIAFVMPFENRGEAVGATISHPHGQLYAFDRLPPLIRTRVEALERYREATSECLSCAVVARDLAAPERSVLEAEHFTAAVPFAPRWPFEVHLRARRHGLRQLADLEPAEQVELAGLLRGVVLRYDALFGFELPFMMVVMDAPNDAPDWHLAIEFYPPHRSERLTKVRASVETATALFINDTLPETSAARLVASTLPPPEELPVPVRVVAED